MTDTGCPCSTCKRDERWSANWNKSTEGHLWLVVSKDDVDPKDRFSLEVWQDFVDEYERSFVQESMNTTYYSWMRFLEKHGLLEEVSA